MQNPSIEVLKLTSDGLVFGTKSFVRILDKISDKNVAFFSVTGTPRTGKSLLLNYFLRFLKYKDTDDYCVNRANESLLTGFNLRTTDKSVTNGIWLWSEPFVVTASDGSEVVLLLMETRCNFEDKANYRECGIIFALSSLLSSTHIINIKSDLSENVLKFVECFARFAQSINGDSQTELFQRLVFLVRDWESEWLYRYGYHDAYTTDDNNYMKSMITPHSNHCFEDQNIRKSLLACFSDISTYLMPHPGKQVTKPLFCGQIDLIDMDFSEKVEEFFHLIIGKLVPKTNANRALTGNSLKHYLNKWQQIMCIGKPDVKSLCPAVSDSAALEVAFKSACNLYETRIRSFIELNPFDDEVLNDYHINAAQESWDYLITQLNTNVSEEFLDGMRENFRQRISETLEIYINKNLSPFNKFTQQTSICCLAKLNGQIENYSQKPKNILCVQLPFSYNGSCEPVDQFWSCYICNETLEYGFDGYFYCECGRADVYSFEFKCISKDHPLIYVQFNKRELKQLLSNKEINILNMGETGVGKSTWINGLVNYLTYPSLAEAKEHKLLSLIASKFTMTDNNYQRHVITWGEDANEVLITGHTATQEPKAYVFEYENKLIRIIDTPGIGDTRGIDQDKKNFDMILRYLTNLEKLHGICILLKPNNARLGVMFRFCIKELLTHLHRDASRNIVFCFTNARSTFYRPGDTMPALEKLFQENKEVQIKLDKDTVYCMDNESFRFLCALHNQIEFDGKEYNSYSESWDKSVVESKRMIEYICGLTPHSICNTMSLIDTRKIITSLSKPLADITQNILTNINVVEDKKKEIQSLTENDLIDKLYMEVIQLEAIQLGYPRTVCTDKRCVKYHKIEDTTQYATEFVTHCHTHCYLTGVILTSETYPNPEIKQCEAMAGTDNCQHCGCSWEKHMHITYEQKQIKKKVIDKAVEDLIKNKQTVKEGIERQIKVIEEYVKEINDEKDEITVISAKFGGFLRNNSIVPYNDALGEYLDVLIRMEKDKVSAGGDRKTLVGMEKMRKDYDEEVRLLITSMATGKCQQLTPIDMIEWVDKLYSLKHKGNELKQIMDVVSSAKSQQYKFQEITYKSNYKDKPTSFMSRNVKKIKNFWYSKQL